MWKEMEDAGSVTTKKSISRLRFCEAGFISFILGLELVYVENLLRVSQSAIVF